MDVEALAAYLAPLLTPLINVMLRVVVGRYGKSIVLKAAAAEISRQLSTDATTYERLVD